MPDHDFGIPALASRILRGVDRKRDFIAWLKSNGVMAGEHYPVIIPDQEAMRSATHEVIGDCARARRIADTEVSLPIHPYLSDEEIAQVIGVCNQWGG